MALDGDGGIRDHQGASLSIETHSWRGPGIDWCVAGRASTTDSVGLVVVLLRSCYSMR